MIADPVDEPRLGIIGGVGPQATARLYAAIVDGAREATVPSTYPDVVVHSLGFDAARERPFITGTFDDADVEFFVDRLATSLTLLVEAGATAVALACNTLHALLPEALERASVDAACVLDIPTLVSRALVVAQRNVLLLATGATIELGVYERLGQRWLVEHPGALGQQCVERAISASLAGDRNSADHWIERAVAAHPTSPDAVVLGCTDLDLAPRDAVGGVPVVGSLQALVAACVEHVVRRPLPAAAAGVVA